MIKPPSAVGLIIMPPDRWYRNQLLERVAADARIGPDPLLVDALPAAPTFRPSDHYNTIRSFVCDQFINSFAFGDAPEPPGL
jgi:hypothetical protein